MKVDDSYDFDELLMNDVSASIGYDYSAGGQIPEGIGGEQQRIDWTSRGCSAYTWPSGIIQTFRPEMSSYFGSNDELPHLNRAQGWCSSQANCKGLYLDGGELYACQNNSQPTHLRRKQH